MDINTITKGMGSSPDAGERGALFAERISEHPSPVEAVSAISGSALESPLNALVFYTAVNSKI